jgi:hypothetical protein
MSTQMNATISPDRAASHPDPIADTVPSSISHASKRGRQEEADTRDGTRPAAKVARLANAEEETKAQAGDETPEALTTRQIMDLLKDLYSDDKSAIVRTLTEIANLGCRDPPSWQEDEVKMRVLGGHTAIFQVLQRHTGCLEIQEQGCVH